MNHARVDPIDSYHHYNSYVISRLCYPFALNAVAGRNDDRSIFDAIDRVDDVDAQNFLARKFA